MLVLLSCGKDGTGVLATPRFSGTLSGEVRGTLSGVAYFSVTEANRQFFIVGYNEDSGIEFMFSESTMAGMPARRSYQIADAEGQYVSRLVLAGNESLAQSGTVTFSAVSARVVSGSFNVVYEGAAGGTVTFVGTFTATPLPDFHPAVRRLE